MLDNLQRVLDELLPKAAEVDVNIVLSNFAVEGLLNGDEIRLINHEILNGSKFHVMMELLKPKPDHVFTTLQKVCREHHWIDLLNYTKSKLLSVHRQDLLMSEVPENTFGNVTRNPTRNKIQEQERVKEMKNIKENLLVKLRTDVDVMVRHWSRRGVWRHDDWKTFYNSNIVIKNRYGHALENIKSFTNLFENVDFRRIVVSGPAGYGKSTFVHEMVRQWINNCEWSERFTFVFLFRLEDIRRSGQLNNENPIKLEKLLQKFLSESDANLFLSYFKEKDLWSETLFVIDGFDELHRSLIPKDIYELILGTSYYEPYIVITTRPDSCMQVLNDNCNVYLELNGFTDDAVNEQLEKFGAGELSIHIEKDILKVPLFNTLIGIIHGQEKMRTTNQWSLIDNTVKYLISRYKNDEMKPELSVKRENQIFSLLGQSAQVQFAIMRKYDEHIARTEGNSYSYMKAVDTVHMPAFSIPLNRLLLTIAQEADLILPSNPDNTVVFLHQMFADYFAAHFWWKSHSLKVSRLTGLYSNIVCFEDGSCCESTSLFSSFLTFFDKDIGSKEYKDYKLEIWKLLSECTGDVNIPLFEDYQEKSLPQIQLKCKSIDFSTLQNRMACLAAKKIKLPNTIAIGCIGFECLSCIGNVTFLTNVSLFKCSFDVTASEFFTTCYNIVDLQLQLCTFQKVLNNSVSRTPAIRLNQLTVSDPNGEATQRFILETITMSNNLKRLSLMCAVNNCDWIKELNTLNTSKHFEIVIELGKLGYMALNFDEILNILSNKVPKTSDEILIVSFTFI